jgi:hypothetical protein
MVIWVTLNSLGQLSHTGTTLIRFNLKPGLRDEFDQEILKLT